MMTLHFKGTLTCLSLLVRHVMHQSHSDKERKSQKILDHVICGGFPKNWMRMTMNENMEKGHVGYMEICECCSPFYCATWLQRNLWWLPTRVRVLKQASSTFSGCFPNSTMQFTVLENLQVQLSLTLKFRFVQPTYKSNGNATARVTL